MNSPVKSTGKKQNNALEDGATIFLEKAGSSFLQRGSDTFVRYKKHRRVSVLALYC